MADVLGQAVVEIAPDVRRFAGQLRSEVGGALKGVGVVAGGILSADLFRGFQRESTKLLSGARDAASKLEQSVGGVTTVFGESARQVLKWGEQNAQSFGLSRRAFNEAVTPLGALLRNAGLSMDEASKRTIDLTKRAADMAATFGGPVDQALQAIQAGLRGELDPLERFGVKLDAAAVEARALADSGKTVASSLTEQEKSTARLNLIMDQTAVTQGQFAREANTLAGAQARSRAAIENFQATLGGTFNPLLVVAHNLLADLLTAFNDLPAPVRGALTVVIGLGAAVASLLPTLAAASLALTSMGVTAGGIGGKLAGVRAFLLGPWGIAIAAGVGLLAAFGAATASAGARQQEFADAAKDLNAVIRDQGGAINETVRAKAAEILESKGALRAAQDLGLSVAQVTDAYLGQGTALDDLRSRLQALVAQNTVVDTSTGTTIETLSEQGRKYQDLLDLINGLVGGRDADAAASRRQADATGGVTDAARKAADALKAQAEQLDRVFEGLVKTGQIALSARQAESQFEAAVDDATEALRRNGATLDVTTEKGRANRSALDEIASSALNLVGRLRETGASTAELQGRMTTARTEFVRVATQAGLTAAQANNLANQLGLIPGNYTARVMMDASQFFAVLPSVRSAIASLNAARISIRGAIPGFAAGGPFRAGQVALVGELGPELVRFDRPGRIFTADETRAMTRRVNGMLAPRPRAAEPGAPTPAGPTEITIPIHIGDEVVRTVNVVIDDRNRADRVRVLTGVRRSP